MRHEARARARFLHILIHGERATDRVRQSYTAYMAAAVRNRLPALDWMRGLVMVLMTIDHASDAFNAGRLVHRQRVHVEARHAAARRRSSSRAGSRTSARRRSCSSPARARAQRRAPARRRASAPRAIDRYILVARRRSSPPSTLVDVARRARPGAGAPPGALRDRRQPRRCMALAAPALRPRAARRGAALIARRRAAGRPRLPRAARRRRCRPRC